MLERVSRKASRELVKRTTRTIPMDGLVRAGSDYGGWWYPPALLDSDSVCYLGGLGEDATFDLALADQVGCQVWAIDPTPRSVQFAATIDHPRFNFLPVGLWSESTKLRFYAPANPEHVSHSVVNTQGTATYFTAACQSVRSIMDDLGHDRLDLLKLDIEGAEVAVIEDLLDNGPLPRVLLVEFDTVEVPWKTMKRIGRLTERGYVCRHIEGRNYTFARQ